jgi:hypothetical protein
LVHRFIGLATVRAARHDNNGEQNIYIVAAADKLQSGRAAGCRQHEILLTIMAR